MDKIRYLGTFFVPPEQNNQLSGILTYSSESGCNLELFGVFGDSLNPPRIIKGMTADGLLVSLYNNHLLKHSVRSNGFDTSLYYSQYLFEGIGVDYRRDLSFKTIGVRFNVLNSWLNAESFHSVIRNGEDTKIDLSKRGADEKIVILSTGAKLKIKSYPIRPQKRYPVRELLLSQDSEIVFQFAKRISFELQMDYVKHLQNLLTFFTLIPAIPDNIFIRFRTNHSKQEYNAKVFMQLNDSLKTNDIGISRDYIIDYPTLLPEIENVLKKWYQEFEKFRLVIQEFCSPYYNPKMLIEQQFLCYARGLETFHREFRNSNDINNKDKYKELFEEGRKSFNWLLKEKSKEAFCEKIKNIRNDFTHNNLNRQSIVKKPKNIVRTIEKMKVILSSAIFRELGFDNAEIRNMFEKTLEFNLYLS